MNSMPSAPKSTHPSIRILRQTICSYGTIIFIRKEKKYADIAHAEYEIDHVVYELFGVTRDEIDLIERL